MDLTYQLKLCSLDLSGFVSVHKVLGKVMGLLVRRFVSLMRRRFGRELRFICVFFLSKFFLCPDEQLRLVDPRPYNIYLNAPSGAKWLTCPDYETKQRCGGAVAFRRAQDGRGMQVGNTKTLVLASKEQNI